LNIDYGIVHFYYLRLIETCYDIGK